MPTKLTTQQMADYLRITVRALNSRGLKDIPHTVKGKRNDKIYDLSVVMDYLAKKFN